MGAAYPLCGVFRFARPALRCGERIATGFVESAVNQVISKRFVKKQQMRWTPRGAHLLLQVRTKVLNDELRAFERWYPGFGARDQVPLAA